MNEMQQETEQGVEKNTLTAKAVVFGAATGVVAANYFDFNWWQTGLSIFGGSTVFAIGAGIYHYMRDDDSTLSISDHHQGGLDP